MNHHITRWHSLTLSPADRAILDQMEEEMDGYPTDEMLQAACDATFGPIPMTPWEAHKIGFLAMMAVAPILGYLKNVGDDDDPCYIPCAKGDFGAFAVIPAQSAVT